MSLINQLEQENKMLKFKLSLIDEQFFCEHAERFTKFIEEKKLNIFYKENELFYYSDIEDITANAVLSKYVDQLKDF